MANDTQRQSSSRLDPLIDHLVNGRFRIRRVIARGGMGRVYYAIQEPLGRAVALKVVRDDDAGAGAMRSHERFLLEADILARLQHPNIVSLIDFGTMEGAFAGQSFIAMEHLGGETLAQCLQGGRRLPPSQVLAIAAQIARGLRAAHDRGVVHRDLKPSNVMLVPDADGEVIVKLVDFGIAKLIWDERDGRGKENHDLTGLGGVVGTPQFMAPEQVEGRTLAAADLYAVGTLLFLALTGRLPFDGASPTEILRGKIARVAPRVREVAPDVVVSDDLEALIASLLEREPEQRPTTSELTRAILACAQRPQPANEARTAAAPKTVDVRAAGALEAGTSASLLPPASSTAASSRPATVLGALTGERRGLAARLTPLVVAALVVYSVVLVLVFGGREPAERADRPAGSSAATAPAITATPPAPAGGAHTKSSFELAIDSVPTGATVVEDGRVLGVAPLVVAIDRASVAAGSRLFSLQKSGFEPVTLAQGPSREDVRTVVALARAAPQLTPARALAPAPPAPPPSASASAPAQPPAPAPAIQVFSTGK